nr:gliding motility lipoprotein GldB [uncultured Flavobacterium sp.]
MKKYLTLSLAAVLLFACKGENKAEDKIAEVKVDKVTVVRFDDLFYNAKPSDLPKLKAEFPYFFPEGNVDTVWTNKLNNPLLQELHHEVDKKFPGTKNLEADFTELYQHIKYYYPEAPQPKVVTLISEMDYQNRAIYTDSLALVSLDLYLGKEHKFYVDFPQYIRQDFEPAQLMPDMVTAFAYGKIAPPKDRTLLSLMIYYGKELYLKDKLIPSVSDDDKIAFTAEQMKWTKANEVEIWRYFVENKLFFDTDPKLPARFINPAPFSKFYLGFDKESPGRIGQWIGWQIVRSYMEQNNKVTLQQLLALDAKTIFDNSKYKPAK